MKYKVRVNSKNESIEAQDLGKILGYSRPDYEVKDKAIPEGYVCLGFENDDKSVDKLILLVNGFNSVDEDSIRDYVELSLAELRSMVKPKEYLTKNKEGGYSLVNHRFSDKDIKVPEGAIIAVHYNRSGKIYFWKDNETHLVGEAWVSCEPNGLRTIESFLSEHKDYCIVVWQRHTQPEELPFVDDGDDDKCDSKLGNFVVDDTLNQRQSQYGEFKDVADTTQKLMSFLTGNGYTCVQLESLHMICSKLARIANGDPNHIDSWHDIAGYATLVVNDLS